MVCKYVQSKNVFYTRNILTDIMGINILEMIYNECKW